MKIVFVGPPDRQGFISIVNKLLCSVQAELIFFREVEITGEPMREN